MALTTINSGGVKDDSIVNADIKSDAAIAGTKVAPNFGSQNIVTTGTVGIGTTSPATDLHIQDTSANPQVRISSANDGMCEIQFGDQADTVRGNIIYRNGSAGDALCFNGYNNTERMRIDSSGKVGIGTTSPAQLLHIEGASPIIQFKDTDNSDNIYSLINAGGSAGRLLFQVDPANEGTDSHVRFDIDGTERLRITSGGLIGINESTPTGTTHIKSHNNGWEGGLILEENNANEGWNLHADNNNDLMIGRNSDTTTTSANITHIATFTTDGLKLENGKGINFSAYSTGASGSGSPDPSSNLLDDYEEGTFTLQGTSGGVSLTMQASKYVKVGRLVHVQFYASTDNVTHNSQDAELDGLPFATAPNQYAVGTIDIGHGGVKGNYIRIVANSNNVQFFYPGEGSAARVQMIGTNIGAGSYIIGTITYHTDMDN